jgi:hypothetical protein
MAKKRNRAMRRLHRKALGLQASASTSEQMSFPAEIDLSAAESEGKLPTFSMVAYTGGKMRPSSFFSETVVDLGGMKISAGARPILMGHDAASIVGHTTKITADDGKITAEGVISGVGEAAEQVVGAAKNGFPWKASIGASVEKMVFVDDGEKVRVNGREFSGPLNVVRKSVLGEISFVPLAADDKTQARVAASANIGVNSMEFNAWLEAKGFSIDDLDDAQKATLKLAYDADSADPPPPPEPPVAPALAADADSTTLTADAVVSDIRAQAADEMKRLAGINKLCDGQEEIKAKAITEGWDLVRTELEVNKQQLEDLRAARPSGPAIHRFDDDKNAQAIEASLLIGYGGVTEAKAGEWYDEKVMNAATSKDYRGLGLHATMHECIRAAGMSYPAGKRDNDFIRKTFEADAKVMDLQAATSGFSTVSLSGILSNVANKSLLASFLAVDDTLGRISSSADAPDFKQMSSYRMTGLGEFTQLPPDGEIKHIRPSEETFTNQVDTYAAMISLTRTTMINDDLNAFLLIPRTIGRKSAIKLQKVGFTEFLDNATFFAAGNSNYFEGAATNLQISSLTTALKLFREQTDANGDPISVNPGILLVPPALEVTAMDIFQETRVNETTTANKKSPANNPHVGNYTPVVSPWIGAGQSISGSSDLAWYLLSDTLDISCLEVIYLGGRRAPVLESAESSFNTLGMQFRGYFDFGVSKMETRAGVKSKGEA